MARARPAAMEMFVTSLGKSYMCPSPPIINLYEPKAEKPSVVVRFTHVHFQAFQIEMGKFSPSKYFFVIISIEYDRQLISCPKSLAAAV